MALTVIILWPLHNKPHKTTQLAYFFRDSGKLSIDPTCTTATTTTTTTTKTIWVPLDCRWRIWLRRGHSQSYLISLLSFCPSEPTLQAANLSALGRKEPATFLLGRP